MSEENFVSYTDEELDRMPGRTDWARFRGMTEAEIEANARSDPDNPPWTEDELANAEWVLPNSPKRRVTMNVDEEVIQFFKRQGGGYQTRINDVLRVYVRSRQRRESA